MANRMLIRHGAFDQFRRGVRWTLFVMYHNRTPAMNRAALAVVCPVLICTAGVSPGAQAQTSHPYDGRWSVALVCKDTQDKTGLVKGYTYTFFVDIKAGRIDGRFDEPKPPAFVHFDGQVMSDGALTIKANGLSGLPEATIGKVRRGTPYTYNMKGKLELSSGKAERIELRPCTAEFFKQQ